MSDLIERQAAIDALTKNKEMINAFLYSLTRDYNTRINQEQRRGQINEDIETIKALSPAQTEITEDEVAEFVSKNGFVVVPAEYLEQLEKETSSHPRKKGKWIHKPGIYGAVYCSECDFELRINDTPYCPNCGAEIVKERVMSNDLISRQALLESVERISVKGNVLDDDWIYRFIKEFPSAEPESKETSSTHKALDTISRRAAIGALHTQFRDGFDGDKWWNSTHVLAAIEGVPSTGPRWVPVTERLPEDGTEVWVTTDMLFEVTRARWHEDSNLWSPPYNSECLLVLPPIAWMEMSFPEPYKGGVE